MINYERLLKVLLELKERSEDGAVILVEGRRDVLSLRKLGVYGKIITVSNVSKAKLVDELGYCDVIILTDWDEKGEILKRDLVAKLSSWGVVADTSLRKRLFEVVGKVVTEVEDLADLFFKLQIHPRSL